MKFESKYKSFHSRKCNWKYRLQNGGHFSRGRWVTPVMMHFTNVHTAVCTLSGSIFFRHPTIDTPVYLANMGKIWGIFCEFMLWFMFFLNHCSDVCNIMLYLVCVIRTLNCIYQGSSSLNRRPLDKMATISQKISSDGFSWMKSFVFWFHWFHWSLFLRFQMTIIQNWFR